MSGASEAAAERAIIVLKRAIDAAENSNQAGENLVVAAAAAPELVEALEEVTAELAEFTDILVNGIRDERMGGMVDRARAALAKARGQGGAA